MHRVASSTVAILMKPKPLERSDYKCYCERQMPLFCGKDTYPLIINNGDLFNPPKSTEFFIKVTFLSTDTETKNTKYIGRIRRLLGRVSV